LALNVSQNLLVTASERVNSNSEFTPSVRFRRNVASRPTSASHIRGALLALLAARNV
jgi:hypothetical protein